MKHKEKPTLPRGKYLLIGAGLLLGIFLLIVGGMGGESEAKTEIATPSAEEYCLTLEKRLEALCREVSGAGDVRVMITLSGGYGNIYETNSKGDPVTVGSGREENAVLALTETPKIVGVGIVATGAGKESVKNELMALVAATLGIGIHKIYVTP